MLISDFYGGYDSLPCRQQKYTGPTPPTWFFDCAKTSAVIATDASFAVCFETAVASTDRREDLSFAAAVKSTDRSFAR